MSPNKILSMVLIWGCLQITLASYINITERSGRIWDSNQCLPDYNKCGRANVDRRVVGGTPVSRNEYPWLSLLRYRDRHLCGSTLITSKTLITAAHCKKRDVAVEDYNVLVGLHSMQETAYASEHKVSEFYVFPNYSPETITSDIAMITLRDTVIFTPTVQPICLILQNENPYSYASGTVTGWGGEFIGDASKDIPYEVDVPIFSRKTCIAKFEKVYHLPEKTFCAGTSQGGKDSCTGDSGGPLMIKKWENGYFKYYLAGIVSYGGECGDPDHPGVYTDVRKYLGEIWGIYFKKCH